MDAAGNYSKIVADSLAGKEQLKEQQMEQQIEQHMESGDPDRDENVG
jgi:hypothetical protein